MVRLRCTHVDGDRGSAPCGRPHRKLEPTDIHSVFFSCKKVGVFLNQTFVFGWNKKWKFFVNII